LSRPPASIDLVCKDFDAALELLRCAGLRLDVIYPADQPHTAILDQDGRALRLTSEPEAAQPGERVEFLPEFVLTRAGDSGSEGRAGMTYRDLIPSRLGGAYVASHIAIPDGGPVADWVHFHKVGFQIIFVRRGWVRVVYEGQGDPFVMCAGDLVLQPPEIRHRVLESSPGLEVIEVGSPALHETIADHEMTLPTARDPARSFVGQRFLRHVAADAPWLPFNGGQCQQTGLAEATGGIADALVIRPGGSAKIDFRAHDGELVFGFVLEGSAELEREGRTRLGPADAFVIPPRGPWSLGALSEDFSFLHVTTGKIT
jgi:quercetin dioxygenase-like cupin family protein